MAKKRKFLDFLDMIDGGGAGQMGDEFEGGGLLSLLANMAASPYGSEDEMRRKARQDFYSSQNIGGGSQSGGARVNRPMARPSQMPMGELPMNAFPNIQDMRRSGQFNPDAPVPSFPPNMSGPPAVEYAPTAQTAPAKSPFQEHGGMPPAPYTPLAKSPFQEHGGMPPAPYTSSANTFNSAPTLPPVAEDLSNDPDYVEYLEIISKLAGPGYVETIPKEDLISSYQDYRIKVFGQ